MTINPLRLGQQVFRSAGDAFNHATAWGMVGKDMVEQLPSIVRSQEKLPISVQRGLEAGWDPLLRTTRPYTVSFLK
jgi:hypothetical protein